MRIFKNKVFSSFADKEKISNRDLCEAVERAERGLIDAELGDGVIKQRIARPNEGKSGGFRSIILFRIGERAIFAFGFAKNRRDNISANELKVLKGLAKEFLIYTDEQIEKAIETNVLTEVKSDEKDLQK